MSSRRLKIAVDSRLPESVEPTVKRLYSVVERHYRSVHPGRKTERECHDEFVADVFGSQERYERHRAAFDDQRNEWQEPVERLSRWLDTELDQRIEEVREFYAVTRAVEPGVVVETGVANGLSTLAVLLALEDNGYGQLYSVDYPFRADESLAAFRSETWSGSGGMAIPADEDPGWVIPDDAEYRDRWSLRLGKSQRELPRLLTEIDGPDLFFHDSEHSLPCMLFELELANEWVGKGGVIVVDDVQWNHAFDSFTSVRDPGRWGYISDEIGYVGPLE
ncbi:MAG: class I SAM-dependent methyltransferase [Halobacteriales archaeon]